MQMLILGIKKLPKGTERQGKRERQGKKAAKAGGIESWSSFDEVREENTLFMLLYRLCCFLNLLKGGSGTKAPHFIPSAIPGYSCSGKGLVAPSASAESNGSTNQ